MMNLLFLLFLLLIAIFFLRRYKSYQHNKKMLEKIPGHDQFFDPFELFWMIMEPLFPNLVSKILKVRQMSPHHSDQLYEGKKLFKFSTFSHQRIYVRDAEMAKRVTMSKDFDKPLEVYFQLNFLGENILTTNGEGFFIFLFFFFYFIFLFYFFYLFFYLFILFFFY